MMSHTLQIAISLFAGAGAGAVASFIWLRAQLRTQQQEAASLREKLEAAAAAQVHLAELRAQTSVLRHDLRGILSPALLTADRLVSSEDPAIRKAGEIVIRTVERASAKLAEAKAEPGPRSDQRNQP